MKETEKKILAYLKERKWDKLRPSDLAKSISIEASELLENFQWGDATIEEVKKNKEKLKSIKKELADVFIYAFDLAVLLGIDTEKIIDEKLAHIKKKYPAHIMKKMNGKNSGTEDAYWKIKTEYRRKGLN